MMPGDLDTVGLPDALSQSSLPVSSGRRSPSELNCGPLALFAHTPPRVRRFAGNDKARASLIGRRTSPSMSLPRVVGCAGTECFSCCREQIALGCRHSVGRNKVVRHRLFDHKLKPRFARFQLECPMPIALRAPSREYMSCFALRLGFLVVDWIDKDWSAVLVHTSARP